MNKEFEYLKSALNLCVLKSKDTNRISSIACSLSGKYYVSGKIASDTKLLDISSEQGALALSTQQNDFKVYKIITLIENSEQELLTSPLIIKILIDHSIRTGISIEYKVINLKNEIIFEAKDVKNIFSFYSPQFVKLSRIKKARFKNNKIILKSKKIWEYPRLLKQYATEGIERNFPTYDSASGYGAAIITKNNSLYFSGQYSGFSDNTGLHAEMTVILRSLMEKNYEITHLGLISTKYLDFLCNMCGCCRQFLYEISNRFNLDINIFCFAKDNDNYNQYKINNYLIDNWTSKKW